MFGLMGIGFFELIILVIFGLPVLVGIFFFIYWMTGFGKSDDGSNNQ